MTNFLMKNTSSYKLQNTSIYVASQIEPFSKISISFKASGFKGSLLVRSSGSLQWFVQYIDGLARGLYILGYHAWPAQSIASSDIQGRHPIIIIIIKQGRSQLADEEAKSLFMQHKFQLNINTFSRKNKTDGEAYALPGHPLATPICHQIPGTQHSYADGSRPLDGSSIIARLDHACTGTQIKIHALACILLLLLLSLFSTTE